MTQIDARCWLMSRRPVNSRPKAVSASVDNPRGGAGCRMHFSIVTGDGADTRASIRYAFTDLPSRGTLHLRR